MLSLPSEQRKKLGEGTFLGVQLHKTVKTHIYRKSKKDPKTFAHLRLSKVQALYPVYPGSPSQHPGMFRSHFAPPTFSSTFWYKPVLDKWNRFSNWLTKQSTQKKSRTLRLKPISDSWKLVVKLVYTEKNSEMYSPWNDGGTSWNVPTLERATSKCSIIQFSWRSGCIQN